MSAKLENEVANVIHNKMSLFCVQMLIDAIASPVDRLIALESVCVGIIGSSGLSPDGQQEALKLVVEGASARLAKAPP